MRAGFGDCGLDLLDVARLKTNADFAPLAARLKRSSACSRLQRRELADDLTVVITPKPGTPAAWNYDRAVDLEARGRNCACS